MKKLLALLTLVASPAWAVCSTISTDDNTRVRNLAQSEYDHAVEEFQKENVVRGCEHLKLSKSYIKQSDDKIATEYIIILYDKICEVKN